MSGNLRGLLADTGAVLEGHFRLSSGLHSGTYVQKFRLFQHPPIAERLGKGLADLWKGCGAQVVAAPAVGAIVLGHELARALGTRSIFLERIDGAYRTRTGMDLAPGEKVLCAEDVVTTGGSVLEMAGGVEQAGAEVVGFAAVIDRSSGPSPFRKPFKALLKLDAAQWPAELCPLCAKGMPMVTPGSRRREIG